MFARSSPSPSPTRPLPVPRVRSNVEQAPEVSTDLRSAVDSAPSQNCSGSAHLEREERRKDDRFWEVHCLDSLRVDPWCSEEYGRDGQGYLVMRPEKRRRRLEWERRVR